MALQGTLETFALPDVLRLLASTHKTGRLRLTGAEGSGSLWLREGGVVASEASRAPLAQDATDVVFELLRFKAGDFVFDDDETAPAEGDPADVEETLTAAEGMLSEWRAIEAVVPSLDGWVSLRADLPSDEVTLDGERWHQIVTIGSGMTVGGLGEALSLGELPVSRTVKNLVEAGLVEVGDVPTGAAAAVAAPPEPVYEARHSEVPEPEPPVLSVVSDEPEAALAPMPPLESVGAPAPDAEERFDPNALVIGEPTYAGESAAAGESEDELTDAAEIARQLANLSPKAAKAVAAAAKATTDEEREAALAEVDETEDPINRGLLLKFLGSVNG